MGRQLASCSDFPPSKAQASGNAAHFSKGEEVFVSDTKDYVWFNTEFTRQIDIIVAMKNMVPQSVDPSAGEYIIASLPIYAGTGALRQHTGDLKMGVTRTSEYRYSFRCFVTDPDGTELGAYWGTAVVNFPSGGVWTGSDDNWKCYLALCEWTNGLGGHFVGLYFNMSTVSNTTFQGHYGTAYRAGGGEINLATLYDTFGIYGEDTGVPVPFSPEYGPAAEDGGYGPQDPGGSSGGSGGPGPTFDSASDPWTDTPVKPGVLSFGLLNIYKCDGGALANLGRDLFPEITWPPATGFSDLIEWLGMTIQALSDSVWNKGLIDYIVSVHLIPVDVTGGALEDIKIGPRTMTGILCRPISNDVVEIDCGTVHVDEYYTSYIDYITQCRVYIPFYGMVSIKPEYWQSADIQLKYLWNVMDGSFIAQLFSTITRHQKPCKTMIGQYSGCACVHLPLSGANYANMFSQLAGAAGGAAAGVASGNVALAATSAMNYAGAVGNTGNMEQSNAYNASSAFYGHARPYLIIERPVSHFSTGYNVENGLPLIVTKRIGDCSGLTICDNPILNFACSDEEAKEIIAALKEGIIL